MSKALRIKPHHAEGAQRYLVFGKNESHELMLRLIEERLEQDPEAELIFVRDLDDFCREHCTHEGERPLCEMGQSIHSEIAMMDAVVAREHGWEFDEPYKIKDILEELKREAPNRKIFYICELTREQFEMWEADVRASKK